MALAGRVDFIFVVPMDNIFPVAEDVVLYHISDFSLSTQHFVLFLCPFLFQNVQHGSD